MIGDESVFNHCPSFSALALGVKIWFSHCREAKYFKIGASVIFDLHFPLWYLQVYFSIAKPGNHNLPLT